MKFVTTLLIICVLALTASGMVVVYSIAAAAPAAAHSSAPDASAWHSVSRQLFACGLGVVGACLVALLEPRQIKALSPWLLALAGLMLVAVLIPQIGTRVAGARRWFRLAGFQFQPSDFAKVAVVIFVAHYGSHYQRLMRSFGTGIAVPGLVVGLFVGLIFLEPDWGTALLIAIVTVALLLIAGARWQFLVLPGLALGVVVGFLLWKDPVRSDRVYSWLHLEETREGVGYQAWQARLALGSGGWSGKGLDQSTQRKFVPEARTDFVFAIIGEEFGWLGSMAVLGVFVTVFLCGVLIAWRAPDPFGMLLASGISLLIGLQALINVAVVSGAVPNKGIALPFVSYGGSNLLMMLLSVGLLVGIARSVGAAAPETEKETDLPAVPVTKLG